MQSLFKITALLALLVAPATAQIDLVGNVFDGTGGPLLSGQVYHTTGFTVPSGQTLTMEPGAILKVDSGSISLFGSFVKSSTTSLAYVTSIHEDSLGGDSNGNGGATSASPGDWGGFAIRPTGSLALDGVELRWGGRVGSGNAPVQMEGGTLELRNSLIHRAEGEGIDLRRPINTGTITAIENCAMVQCGTYPIDSAALDDMPAFSFIEALGNTLGDYIRVTDGSLAADTTITVDNLANGDRGALVLAAGSPAGSVPAGVTLTLEAQVVLKFEDSVVSSQRGFNVDGTLRFRGAKHRPVIVTSFHDDDHGGDTNEDGVSSGSPGDWAGLRAQTGGTIDLEYALLRFGGSHSMRPPVASAGGFVRMRNVLVEQAALSGMTMGGSAAGYPIPDVQRCSFNDNGAYPVDTLSLEHVSGFRDIKASGNLLSDAMRVSKATVPQDAVIGPDNYSGRALIIATPITIPDASVTLERGTILKFTVQSTVQMGHFINMTPGALHLRGTAFEPVVITGIDDDEWGGDTGKDGSTPETTNAWNGLVYNAGAGGSLENALLRFANLPVTNLSANVTMRSVRAEHNAVSGFRLFALAGDAVNLVALDSGDDGIELLDGSFDLIHATSVDAFDNGISSGTVHTGNVVNSISWGNGTNYALNSTGLSFSCGVAVNDPVNNNIAADPMFVDQSGGDLNLQTGSPCIDSADFAAAIAVVKDHDEFSRLLDPTLSGNLRADRGAYENHRWRMSVIGRAYVGATMILEVHGPVPGFSFFGLSFADTPELMDPLGFHLIGNPGLPASVIGLGLGPVNTQRLIRIPYMLSLVGLEFGIQTTTISSSIPFRGENTNLYRSCILPRRPGKPLLITTPPELSGGVIQLR